MSVSTILLDVEGTTSSIAFVYDQMFPYARRHLAGYCHNNWGSEGLSEVVELLAKDAGFESSRDWFKTLDISQQTSVVIDFASQLMDSDSKATGLKALQGLLWKSGFESGELKSHLFDEVAPCLQKWHSRGIDLAIYSSGSIAAQRLFFGHTIQGDLNGLFKANFDTTTGPKRDATSYVKICQALEAAPSSVLFLSDIAQELEAAEIAGLQSAAVVRPGNSELPGTYDGPRITSFEQLIVSSRT